jgi:hypothetical protein
MLSTKAVNLMLQTFKGLKRARIYNNNDTEMGDSLVNWNNATAKTIKTQPFSIETDFVANVPLKNITINGYVPKVSSKESILTGSVGSVDGWFDRLSQAYFGSLRGDYPIMVGKEGFDFIIYYIGSGAMLNLQGIPSQKVTTPIYNGNPDEMDISLYNFIQARNPQFSTNQAELYNIDNGYATINLLVVQTRTKYQVHDNSTTLNYNLADTSQNVTLDVKTLIKFTNGITERLNNI